MFSWKRWFGAGWLTVAMVVEQGRNSFQRWAIRSCKRDQILVRSLPGHVLKARAAVFCVGVDCLFVCATLRFHGFHLPC